MHRRCCCFLVGILGLVFAVAPLAKASSVSLEPYPSNIGVNVELEQNSPNYSVTSIMDIVGGDATSSGGSGANVMHGYHLLDESDLGLIISTIVAVPERRTPLLNNNATHFLIEIYGVWHDTTTTTALWTNASLAPAVTNTSGVWTGTYQVNLSPSTYDVYVTGVSTLKRRLGAVTLAASSNTLNFTDAQASANNPPRTRAGHALYSGDAAVFSDADGSCGLGAICTNYTGDEWGDNYVNGLDLTAINRRLFNQTPSEIMKEDLNGDGLVNGLDLTIAQANILRFGDR